MPHSGTAAVKPPGVPSQTRWMLPNGFGSIDLSPETAAFPREIGDVSHVQHSLGPGLEVYTYAASYRTPLTMTYEVLTGQPYLWLVTNFTGRSEFRHGKAIDGVATADRSYFAMLRDPLTKLIYPASAHRSAGMAVSPARLNEMLHGQRLGRPIDDFLDGKFDPLLASSRPTEALLRIASQIFNHPYQGPMASVFLEAKAFEMLAETLRVVLDEHHPAEIGRGRRCALAAREIIMANLAHPPRIEEVARQVGLSQRRLNEVFQETFGASALQCLVHWRLDLARQLLAVEGATVKQVAHQLGYAHVSNFSLAFTRRFGHAPTRDAGK